MGNFKVDLKNKNTFDVEQPNRQSTAQAGSR